MSDIDTGGAEGGNKRLNRLVAITVVALAVFLGIAKIKDDNICQAMAKAKADAVDTWSEYQATRIKLHIDEEALGALDLAGARSAAAAERRASLQADIDKYAKASPVLQAKARGFDGDYDRLNFHDDQFDASDALIGIAISAAAVASLAEAGWVLTVAWVFGGLGAFMGLAGFAGWPIHPDFLANLLS